MKKITKFLLPALSLLLVTGVAASCDRTTASGGFPPADHVPTSGEESYLEDFGIRNEVIKFTVNNNRTIRANNTTSVRNTIYQDREDAVVVANKIQIPASDKGYSVQITWSISSLYLDYIHLATIEGDDDHKALSFSYATFDPFLDVPGDGGVAPGQDIRKATITCTATFGTWTGNFAYDLDLKPGELPQKAKINEVLEVYAGAPINTSSDSPWLNKRFEVTGRVYNHYDVPDNGGSGWGFRAGVFIVDDSNSSIMLYAQNNSPYASVLLDRFIALNLALEKNQDGSFKPGKVITVRGSVVTYNGAVQLNGITSVELVEDAAIIATMPLTINTIVGTDAILTANGAEGSAALGSTQHVSAIRTLIHRNVTVANVSFVKLTDAGGSNIINSLPVPTVGTDVDGKPTWAGARHLAFFRTAEGLEFRVHLSYHIGPAAFQIFSDLLTVGNKGANFDVVAYGNYSTNIMELVAVGANAFTLRA